MVPATRGLAMMMPFVVPFNDGVVVAVAVAIAVAIAVADASDSSLFLSCSSFLSVVVVVRIG